MILTISLLVPLLAALLLAFPLHWPQRYYRGFATGIALVPCLLLVIAWVNFDTRGSLFQHVHEVPWVPSLGMAWRVGADGIALAVATMSSFLIAGAAFYPVDTYGRARQYYAWILFLQAVSLGVFLALDLLLFYVFFDLNLVAMYFLIARWGHGKARFAATKFFLFTLCGSLALLLGILGLYLSVEPRTFDMRILIEQQPLAGTGLLASLVFLGLMVGLIIKTPLAPLHTWLPQAHVDSPGPVSAILAGVLLKMGTYGMIRIPYSMMRQTFEQYALAIAVLALVSILYGALVALAQHNLKRRIAYTSINHMGYTVLGIAAAGALMSDSPMAQRLALTGATVEMVAHGLITGSLFFITGSFWQRTREYDLDAYGGLAAKAPVLAFAMVLAAFASFGLPGLAGFVAEFQIFAGTFAIYPWLASIGLLGILITAALFLQMLQKLFFGSLPQRWTEFTDLGRDERLVLAVLLLAVVVIGIYPNVLLGPIEASVTLLVGRP
ncbi:complex I subunit 4 family protein [Bowmanella dokdonensis]|uniref:NADH-quinone oxidoreductase subunit M n=1 Tax=Bowmanella dokdonensis TaxID=751969 RepID=A0A939DLZ5_9ALTE|nr:NADH-quinone oxidoreductase subunit M [Bowmanella dokdonensis]MBN7824286.1 NADH-quinone oxidoreductase subunit M [Bowmanella dokdonensis]